jgi:hypothetical protein
MTLTRMSWYLRHVQAIAFPRRIWRYPVVERHGKGKWKKEVPSLAQSSCRTNVWHTLETRQTAPRYHRLRLVPLSACSPLVKMAMLRNTRTRSRRHHLGSHLNCTVTVLPPDHDGVGGPAYHHRPLNIHGQGMTVGGTSFAVYSPRAPDA